jgi:uncharacterized membrane protein YeaQ/YmgE (transglycosylase-associated protein family)
VSGHHEAEPVTPWPGGWLVALLAGLFGAVLARWLGEVGMGTATGIGAFVFLVHAVVLALHWSEPVAQGEGHDGHHH